MRCAAAMPHDATRALQERHVDATQGVDFHTLPTYGRNRCNCNTRLNERGGERAERYALSPQGVGVPHLAACI